MRRLKADWFVDGLLDFEYKKYTLLSYLKEVSTSFNKVELYPFLADLVFHYNNILEFKKNKKFISEKFPVRLREIDLAKLELLYAKLVEEDGVLQEVEDILEYALPLFKQNLEEGKEIYEFVEQQCELSPIGLMPLYADEGYFFLEQPERSKASVYRYQITVFENATENLRGIHTSYVKSFSRGIGDTYENLKMKLTNTINELPNPAVFLINTKMRFPTEPTLLPIIKRLLVRYVSST